MAKRTGSGRNLGPKQPVNTIVEVDDYFRLCYKVNYDTARLLREFQERRPDIGGVTEMTRRGAAVADILSSHLRIGAHRHDPIETEEILWDLTEKIGRPSITITVNINPDAKVILGRLLKMYPSASFSTIMNASLATYLRLIQLKEAEYHLALFDLEGEATGVELYDI